ncbi:hypothetical protein FACS1894202_07340 [Clostridia bacterium]|nr:hypothetical protein FACS1894202_07340 [Clostridia bacterium]
MNERLTPQRAAQLIHSRYNMHITPLSLGAWISPFGEYIRKKGGQRGMYLIFPERLDEYFRPLRGLSQRPLDMMYCQMGGE